MKRFLSIPILLLALFSTGCPIPQQDDQQQFTFEDIPAPAVDAGYSFEEPAIPVEPRGLVPQPICIPAKPRKMSLEIVAPPAETMAAVRYEVTVYTAEDKNGKGWCTNCLADHRQNGDGDERVHLTWSGKFPPFKAPEYNFPVYTWRDASNTVRFTEGRRTLDKLFKTVDKTMQPPAAAPKRSTVYFGPNPWFENETGRTSVQHLMSEHGLTWEQIEPFANDQHALDLIHGWKHEGRGRPVTILTSNSHDRQFLLKHEKRHAPHGKAGTFHGQSQILEAQDWWRTNIGEGVKGRAVWLRTGARTKSLLTTWKFSRKEMLGDLSKLRLSAPGCKLPVDECEITYEALSPTKYRVSGGVEIESADDSVLPKLNTVGSNGQPVGFVDPATLSTIFTVASGIWSICHPVADITLGGNVSATAVLTGDKLDVDFEEIPQVKIILLFTFDLGVRHVSITPKNIHVDFIANNFVANVLAHFVKSRDFAVAE